MCITHAKAKGRSVFLLSGHRRERVLIGGKLLTIQTTDGSLKAFWIPLAPVIGHQLDASFRLSRELANRKFT